MVTELWELAFLPIFNLLLIFFLAMFVAPFFFSVDTRCLPLLKSAFRYLFQGVFFAILITYLLTLLKLFEFFSLFGAYVLTIAFARKRRTTAQAQGDCRPIDNTFFLDRMDEEIGYRDRALLVWRKVRTGLLNSLHKITRYNLVMFALIAGAISLRFAVRILYPTLAMPDPYVHLAWAKIILLENRLFSDGVYPLGIHALIVSLGRLSNVDYYHILRFLGPIGGGILIVGFYWFLREVTGKRLPAALGIIAFGFSTYNGLPTVFSRQATTLPMEWSIALVFPGLIFLHNYIIKGEREDLLLWGIAVVDVVIIHSYGALFFAIGSFLLLVTGAYSRSLNGRGLKHIFAAGLGGGAIGMLPILVGKLQGIPWHTSSVTWISENMKVATPTEFLLGLARDLSAQPLHLLIGGGLLAGGLLWATRNDYRGGRTLWPTTVLMLMPVIGLLYLGPNYGFSLLESNRIQLFLTLCLIAGIGVFIGSAESFLRNCARQFKITKLGDRLTEGWKKTLPAAFLILFTAGWLSLFPIRLYSYDDMENRPLEYDAAMKSYFQIKKEHPALEWTIVGPVEQYQESLGMGFHYELWKFNEDFSLQQAADPNFQLPIPTQHIFIFVEKVPLRIWRRDEMHWVAQSNKGPTEIYYRDEEGRATLENSVRDWCRTYGQSHRDMRIYYEDAELIVYAINHDPKPWIK